MSTSIENFNIVPGVNIDPSLFSASDIQAAQAIVRQYLSDTYQDLDFSALSSLNDLNVRPQAQIFLVIQSLINQFNATNTLSKVIQSPSTASSAIVDALLSNFSVSRVAGTSANGFIKVSILGSPSSLSIQSSYTFSTVDGVVFSPTINYIATATPDLSNPSQIQLYPDQSGTQSFAIVPATAVSTGAIYNIPQYTPLSSAQVYNFVSASAFSAFSGGSDAETDAQVVSRLIPALSVRNLASPLSIEQTLRDNFPYILQINVQGITGDLMTRNSHNIFGVKSGSFCDVYVKTAVSISEVPIEKTATKIISGDASTADFQDYVGKYVVQVSVGDIPGMYDVSRVTPQAANLLSTYTILKKVRGVNATIPSGQTLHSITTVAEGFYSSYGYEYVVFDPVVDPNPGGNYIPVTVYGITTPGIGDIQGFVNSNSNQVALVDTLIKAYVPCIISTSEIKVRVKAGATTALNLQSDVINYINSINPSTDQLRVDGIIATIYKDPAVLSVDTPILITGTILAPDQNATEVVVSTQSILGIPTDVTLGYGPENIAMFTQSSGVPLTIIEV